jgi:hypothetical protein
MVIDEKLLTIQTILKAPKGQFNKFGNYKYRNCEDILESLKPLLSEQKALLLLSDDIVAVNDRVYVKATATLKDVETGHKIEVTAFAREEETKKGMDGSQITGSASSYARKYALNAMFAIDDTKDSDATNQHGQDKSEKNVASNDGKTEANTEKEAIINFVNQNKEIYDEVTKTFKVDEPLTKVNIVKLRTLKKLMEEKLKEYA